VELQVKDLQQATHSDGGARRKEFDANPTPSLFLSELGGTAEAVFHWKPRGVNFVLVRCRWNVRAEIGLQSSGYCHGILS